jgi:multiple sugar transport system substrate-binding protein
MPCPRAAVAGRLAAAGRRAVLALALAVPGPPAFAAVTITVWTHYGFNSQEGSVLRRTVAEFNASQSSYRVDVHSTAPSSYLNWIQSLAVSGSLPCVLDVDGPYVPDFAWSGYLRPLDDLVGGDLLQDLLPSIRRQGVYGGHLYSLGQYESGLGLWANGRYLRAAGVRVPSFEQPWTLEEFEDALRRLARVRGVEYPLNLALYTNTSEFFSFAFLPLLSGFGGDFIERQGAPHAVGVLDGARSVAAMTRFQSWFRAGWARPVRDRADDFEHGRTALAWTGHWKYRDYLDALGADLLLLPLPDFGRGSMSSHGSWSWAISSTCEYPQGAGQFLQYLMSDEQILRMTQVNGAPPGRRSALARSPLYGQGAPLELFARQLSAERAVSRPATPGYGVISEAFSAAVYPN